MTAVPVPALEADRAWGAGLFEGEGSFSIVKKTGDVSAAMNSTDLDVLLTFQRLFGGHISGPKIRPGLKPQWQWRSGGYRNLSALGVAMGPWLHARRSERLYQVLADHLERRAISRMGRESFPRSCRSGRHTMTSRSDQTQRGSCLFCNRQQPSRKAA